jgi:hypothetical protein
MYRAWSRIDRSDEDCPMHASFKIDGRVLALRRLARFPDAGRALQSNAARP